MAETYLDLLSVAATDPGDPLPAAWCDQTRTNFEALIDPPAASVYATSAQSVADDTATVLSAAGENFDNDSWHSTSVNTSRLTSLREQRVTAVATVNYAIDADGIRAVRFIVNGTTTYNGQLVLAADSAHTTRLTAVRAIALDPADYVQVSVTHTAGASLDITLEEFYIIRESR